MLIKKRDSVIKSYQKQAITETTSAPEQTKFGLIMKQYNTLV